MLLKDVLNMTTGEIYVEAGEEITEDLISKLRENNIAEIGILLIDNVNYGPHLRNTLANC